MSAYGNRPLGSAYGFAGLSALVSNVDGLLGALERATSAAAARPKHQDSAFTGSTPQKVPRSSGQLLGRVGIGIVLLVIALGAIGSFFDSSESTITESTPPVGVGHVLTTDQLRYCLAEDIRLEAGRPLTLSESQVDRFNALVEDFNGRCSAAKYNTSIFESTKRSVEARRAALQAEGAARFR